ncbi:hypothetical protein EYS09_02870 [Streptomyces kasugaensis]|uniref:Uncharacterized protein n=1 Tax=Streptomyces kasugaensis TaxID=1946 RepID=A0A4Q9I0I8_STRKA|nr:hypothetical protein EYS09_02870 [Streptomyces kasugaensis]
MADRHRRRRRDYVRGLLAPVSRKNGRQPAEFAEHRAPDGFHGGTVGRAGGRSAGASAKVRRPVRPVPGCRRASYRERVPGLPCRFHRSRRPLGRLRAAVHSIAP